MATCTHLDTIQITQLPAAVDGCQDCLAIGSEWLHLRICLACGHVGCCDDSPNRHVWRHLPLNDVHPNAQMAAEAAEAAAAQGAFWEMHDKLLEHQDELMAPGLTRYAQELGLDVERFWDELRRREHEPRVAGDVATADASGVAGTPSFFINGTRHQGAHDIATLTAAVTAARTLTRLRDKAERPSEPDRVG